jgi:hypothetical protein
MIGVLGRRLQEQKRQTNAEVLRKANQDRLRPGQREVDASGGVRKRKEKPRSASAATSPGEHDSQSGRLSRFYDRLLDNIISRG